MMSHVLCPSDFDRSQLSEGCSVKIGGRVECVTAHHVLLADAFVALTIEHDGSLETIVSPGSIVVVCIVGNGSSLRVAGLEFTSAGPLPSGEGEWAALARSKKARRLAERDRIQRALRAWFHDKRFLEIETPTLLKAAALDAEVDAIAAEQGWLVTSPEHHMKRLLVGGLPRVYQFAKCFRRDELGTRHEPEFTMLEWYRSFSDLDAMLSDTEALIVAAAEAVGAATCVSNGRKVSLERPFLRLSVEEAFTQHAGVRNVDQLAVADRDRYFQLFVDRVEPALTEYDRPVFLHSYPASEAALARLRPDDLRWAERAELYIGGIEICNAYGELSSATEQRRRFEAERQRRSEHGRPCYPLDERFLDALGEGLPQASGNALGFDRLLMVLLGAETIEEVIAFPRRRV